MQPMLVVTQTVGGHVNLGSRIEKKPGNLDVTIHRGFHESCVHLQARVRADSLNFVRMGVDAGTMVQKEFLSLRRHGRPKRLPLAACGHFRYGPPHWRWLPVESDYLLVATKAQAYINGVSYPMTNRALTSAPCPAAGEQYPRYRLEVRLHQCGVPVALTPRSSTLARMASNTPRQPAW
ncbi:hypothetical protein OUZ56_023501 [Daphnia magna]|uniref:Uncharacterized protein n=1 Tax=Daphnia magna TaxID=35525 RepID=A0ABR0AZH6_9CRUS|nr:hypothetical protein OUZ56_023501 [Daphnia magna]